VNIKVLLIEDMISPEVFLALSKTDHLRIFTKVAIKAMVDFVWFKCARTYYSINLVYRFVELALLLWWVLNPELPAHLRRITWSFMCFAFIRDGLYEACELYGLRKLCSSTRHKSKEQDAVSRFLGWFDAAGWSRFFRNWTTPGNMMDAFSVILMLMLVITTYDDSRSNLSGQDDAFVAALVFSRWMELLVACRAYTLIGRKLLPVLQSASAMGGIACVTFFTFMAFLHAFWALGSGGSTFRDILINAIRFLVVGDGDGIDMVLSLGTDDDEETQGFGKIGPIVILVVAMLVFSIWIMNLFIAATDQAYEQALEYSATRFQQERASICMQHMFQPCFPLRWRLRARYIRSLQFFVVIPLWLLALGMEDIPMIIPSVLFAVATCCIEAMTLKSPSYIAEVVKASTPNPPKPRLSSKEPHNLPQPQDRRAHRRHERRDRGEKPMQPPKQCEARSGVVPPEKGGGDHHHHHPEASRVPLPKWKQAAPVSPEPDILKVEDVPEEEDPDVEEEFNDIVRQTSEPPPIQRKGDPMYLWVCYDAEYDERDDWPSENGSNSLVDKFQGRVANMKKDGMMRSKHVNSQLQAIRQKTDKFDMASAHFSGQLQSLHMEMQNFETSISERFAALEDLLRQGVVQTVQAVNETSEPNDSARQNQSAMGDAAALAAVLAAVQAGGVQPSPMMPAAQTCDEQLSAAGFVGLAAARATPPPLTLNEEAYLVPHQSSTPPAAGALAHEGRRPRHQTPNLLPPLQHHQRSGAPSPMVSMSTEYPTGLSRPSAPGPPSAPG